VTPIQAYSSKDDILIKVGNASNRFYAINDIYIAVELTIHSSGLSVELMKPKLHENMIPN